MASGSSGKYALLARLADEFMARYRRGEPPSLQEYLDRYPDLADDIRELFPAMVEIERTKQDRREDKEPPAADHATATPDQVGDYRILRTVGHGGMGIVYEAEQVALGRRVALKMLPPNLLPDERHKRRFEREARAAARLHHTNIVPVFGIGEHDGTPFYVMQFIQGLGLDEVLSELKRLQGESDAAARLGEREPGTSPRDVSAADVARSLLAGQYRPPLDATVAASSGASDDPSPSAFVLRSDSAAPSSSSVALPGQGEDERQPRTRKATYWESVGASACKWPTPSITRTGKASCTATSSRPTFCWTRGASSG